jgi:CRP/FNR family transcriptional regulator, cyclic AMP receptor protein
VGVCTVMELRSTAITGFAVIMRIGCYYFLATLRSRYRRGPTRTTDQDYGKPQASQRRSMTDDVSRDIAASLTESLARIGFSPDQVARVAKLATLHGLPIGTFVFREGELHRTAYLLQSGHVDLIMRTPGRGNQRILTLGPGDLVAWSALVGNGVMTCSALCTEDTSLIALDAAALTDLVEKDAELGYRWMRWVAQSVSQRLLATRLQLLDLFAPISP